MGLHWRLPSLLKKKRVRKREHKQIPPQTEKKKEQRKNSYTH
jgi:hypothetical protein